MRSSIRTWAGSVAALGLAALASGCGDSGSQCTVVDNPDGSATISCDDGTSATVADGMDGTTCTVTDDGAGTKTISCDDGTTVTVTDGTDGTDGMDGMDGTNALITGPGVLLEVTEVGVAADLRPYAELRLTDQAGEPLDREGRLTEGAVSVSFTLAYLPVETRTDGPHVLPYVNYFTETVMSADGSRSGTQPVTDTEGTWTVVDADTGAYRYDFAGTVPATYDATRTHTMGIYATREFDGVEYVANAVPSFRPDGMAVVDTRNIVTNDACNNCHNPLSFHGGSREAVGLCQTCHAAGYEDPDTGNTIDFQTMIHKVHRGADLPSVVAGVGYFFVGRSGRVRDYSTVHFPRSVNECQLCHMGPDGDRWSTKPSRAACGSCHDDVWFEAGDPPESWQVLHAGGDRPTDDMCTTCHEPTGGLEPITENHYTKWQLPTALDLVFAIDAVTVPASRQITVDLTVTVDGTGYDISATPLPRFSVNLAGPTTDYAFFRTYTVSSAGTLTAIDAAAGRFRYVVPDTVETIATAASVPPTGTWTVGLEGYVASAGINYSANNPTAPVAVSGTSTTARRTVVSIENCNACHERLEFHGGARNDPQYCVMCHNGNFDTIGRMPAPAAGSTAETSPLSFAYMIHRIHTGVDGESDYTLYANSGGLVTFDELRYPADRRGCDSCHVDEESYDLPLADGLLPMRYRVIDSAKTVLDEIFVAPAGAACTGCHDSESSVAHAETMTTAMGAEGCATCHAAGRSFGVDVVHARPEYDIR